MAAAALSTFGPPISGVPWMTWRCRFESATASSSMTPSAPTPAAGGWGRRRRAQAPGGGGGPARGLGRRLPRPADLAQHDVASIAFELLRTEHRFDPSPFYAIIGESDGFATRDDRLDLSTRDARCQHRHSFVNRGGRFSMKATMPSLRSLVANKAWKTRRSKRTPSASDVSKLRLTASFAASSD